jgi:outer membrane protein assembly factor BamB
MLAVGDGRSLYGIDADTGSQLWETGPPQISAPTWLLAQEIEVASGGGRSFDRRVFAVSQNGDLSLLDGEDGSIRWAIPVSQHPGSPPDDVVYVAGVDRELLAIETATGSVLWRNDALRVDSPPVLSGAYVYVLVESAIVAVNARSGTEVGRAELPEPASMPIEVVGDTVIVATGRTLMAIGPVR